MPLLYEDTSELHAIAHRIRRHADEVRARAAALAARAEQTRWHSAGAAAFRERARCASHAMRTAAGRLDDAADALDRHANRVHRVLAAMQYVATAAVGEGVQLVDEVGDFVGSALDCIGL
jgi:hypothetical protein